MQPARVMIAAGSDSGGGAGIQADIKAVTALGGFAMTAVTALTAQNTEGVHGVMPVAPEFVLEQLSVTLQDIGADCVKTGMLHDALVVDAVADALERYAPDVPLVVDPVMIAQSGDRLLASEAVAAIKRRLLPRATLVTPNIPEAEVLTDTKIPDLAAMREVAASLYREFGAPVLLKGGHMEGDPMHDVLVWEEGERIFEHARIATENTHGTGCTLASAIATGLAQGLALPDAVVRGREYLLEAIRTAPDLGRGHGPVNHLHTVAPFP